MKNYDERMLMAATPAAGAANSAMAGQDPTLFAGAATRLQNIRYQLDSINERLRFKLDGVYGPQDHGPQKAQPQVDAKVTRSFFNAMFIEYDELEALVMELNNQLQRLDQ